MLNQLTLNAPNKINPKKDYEFKQEEKEVLLMGNNNSSKQTFAKNEEILSSIKEAEKDSNAKESAIVKFFKNIFSAIKSFLASIFPSKDNETQENETTLDDTTDNKTNAEKADVQEDINKDNEASKNEEIIEEWDGSFYFIDKNGNLNQFQTGDKNYGSDDTKKQTLEQNDDGTYTLKTYYKNENGCDNIADEIQTLELIQERFKSGETEFTICNIEPKDIEFNIDSSIDYAKQGARGDCWLLSALNSISYTQEGKKAIENAITKNEDDSYSVTFEGINQTYNITQEELKEARTSGEYSNGDNTVLLMELAVQKALNYVINEYKVEEAFENGADSEVHAAIWLLLYKYNATHETKEYNNLLEGGNMDTLTTLMGISNWNSELSDTEFKKDGYLKEEFSKMDFKNTITQIAFSNESIKTSDQQEDFIITDEHAYTIKSYNAKDETITIVNPWNSAQTLTIDIDEIKDDIHSIKYQEIE